MRIGIITPAPPRSLSGNRVTALRWARILRGLGHRVRVAPVYQGEPYDLLVTLHARRSYLSAARFHRDHPERPLIVALTGTDLYRDLPRSRRAQQSLEWATRLIALQPKARHALRQHVRSKMRTIYQSFSCARRRSAGSKANRTPPRPGSFDVCVIAHLRPVKDPFRAARAARQLPSASRIRILHLGRAMTAGMARQAQLEMKVNPRYRWLGERPRWRVPQILARSALCVLPSKLEGGANVLSEAIATGTPVLASRIPGSVGILGEDYPGYFTVGNTRQLANLLYRAETEPSFLARLRTHCRKLRPLFDPRRERMAWKRLLAELTDDRHGSRRGFC